MDFDLDLATRQSKDNPVYYVQYAHARVHALSRKLTEMGETLDLTRGLNALDLLTKTRERTGHCHWQVPRFDRACRQ